VDGNPVTSGVQNTFNAGTHTVSETGQATYAATISGDCDAAGLVTLNPGDVKICTVTNDDMPPRLIVIKNVVNGRNNASDFTMNVSGNSPSPASFPGADGPGTLVTLNPGSYSVTETGPAGYTAISSSDCNGTMTIGETKTCIFTNVALTQEASSRTASSRQSTALIPFSPRTSFREL
jgi:hypothetical protein